MQTSFGQSQPSPWQPLADRLRPRRLEEFVGQSQLLGPGKPLRQALDVGALHSMIFWGPPGTGKTTLARLIAARSDAYFIAISAVFAGVKEIRAAVEEAKQKRAEGRRTVLFVDEVHRFNKAQQDGFLPYVEDGTLTFIGATTENPSFELNNALLSRARVYVLRALTPEDLRAVLERALADREHGLGERGLTAEPEALALLAQAADGDARRALNLLEMAADVAAAANAPRIALEQVREVAAGGTRRFDKGGDAFYDQISALHKSVRGSDPDASLYWLARMLDQMGAEQLLGQGDMLYLQPGGGIPMRVHGAFVADHEVHKVASFLKKSGAPVYDESIVSGDTGVSDSGLLQEEGGEGGSNGEADPLYDEALKIVTESRRASISGVQRRLRIGYNRAARLIEEMERAGVVGPLQSNGSREVLAPPPVGVD